MPRNTSIGEARFSVYCDAPMCKRIYHFYEQQLADTHYKRCHEDPRHWAFIALG